MRAGRRSRTSTVDVYWSPNEAGHPRIGLVVPRHGRSAVARNRVRRRLREILRRLVVGRLPAVDLVVRARAEAYECSYRELASDLERWSLSFVH